jgi:hypothetical protein
MRQLRPQTHQHYAANLCAVAVLLPSFRWFTQNTTLNTKLLNIYFFRFLLYYPLLVKLSINIKGNYLRHIITMIHFYATTIFLIILGSLIILLILSVLYNNYKPSAQSTTQLREYSQCPDYWHNLGNNLCYNAFNLGKCSITGDKTMDFSDTVFTNPHTGPPTKCKWAQTCSTYWDGISRLC